MSSSLWSVLEEKIKWWPVTHSVPSRYTCPLRRRETLSIFGDLINSTNSITTKKFAPIETKEDWQKKRRSTFSSFLILVLQLTCKLLGNLAYQPTEVSAVSGFVHRRKSNMATRKALAPKLYKRFLQVCEQWPVDQNRLGRDLGEHLKGNLVPRIKKSQIDVSIRGSWFLVLM